MVFLLLAAVLTSSRIRSRSYTGPCPPDKEHRYVFTLYALDASLPLQEGASKDEVLAALKGHVLAQATLTGRYDRQR